MTDGRVPARFRDDVVRRIGHGGEATVYELRGRRVLRLYHRAPHAQETLAAFYREIARSPLPFAVPEVLDQGEEDGVPYSIDRLIPGRPLHERLRELAGAGRERALASYADAALLIASVPYRREPCGEFLRDADAITAATWPAYLLARLRASLAESTQWLAEDVPALERKIDALTAGIERLPARPKVLVHGDYFPGNVLITDDLRVSGVIDFGPLTVIGDAWMDAASALMFLEVTRQAYTPANSDFVRGRLVRRLGDGFAAAVPLYRAWYAVRFSPYRDDDENLYAWCVRSLREFVPEGA
jgi:aminoglycoside phosphotransferase (APT) family kinase protein